MGSELYNYCDCCGIKDDISKGVTHHTFGGYAGYGSEHDGEYITLVFCSDCLDAMLRTRKPQNNSDQNSQG